MNRENILDKTISSLLNNRRSKTWKISRSEEICANAAKIVLYPFLCLIEASLFSTESPESGNSARNAGNVISNINCGFVFARSERALNTLRLTCQLIPNKRRTKYRHSHLGESHHQNIGPQFQSHYSSKSPLTIIVFEIRQEQ